MSGTHASGKTTLVEAFASAHPEYAVLPDPYEPLDGAEDYVDAGLFFTQLRLAAQRLDGADADAIAERRHHSSLMSRSLPTSRTCLTMPSTASTM